MGGKKSMKAGKNLSDSVVKMEAESSTVYMCIANVDEKETTYCALSGTYMDAVRLLCAAFESLPDYVVKKAIAQFVTRKIVDGSDDPNDSDGSDDTKDESAPVQSEVNAALTNELLEELKKEGESTKKD